MDIQFLVQSNASRDQIESWCRQHTQNYPISDKAMMVRVLGKYLMCVPPRDGALTPHLALDGIWEPWVTMAIARHVKPGMRCMDVGACFGYYSLLMADLAGERGHVQAWEPFWDAELAINHHLNGLPIEIVRMPMGPCQRTRLSAPPRLTDLLYNAGGVSSSPMSDSDSWYREDKVKLAQRPSATRFDFIKIDVEGAERIVWETLADVLKANQKLTVCMEFTPGKHERPLEFLEHIAADGFALGTVGLDDGLPRACSAEEALTPNTGDYRMLWLTR